jgi:hypothetical protein
MILVSIAVGLKLTRVLSDELHRCRFTEVTTIEKYQLRCWHYMQRWSQMEEEMFDELYLNGIAWFILSIVNYCDWEGQGLLLLTTTGHEDSYQ